MFQQAFDFSKKYLTTLLLALHILSPFINIYALLVLNTCHVLSAIWDRKFKKIEIWVSYSLFIIGFGLNYSDTMTSQLLIGISLIKLFRLLEYSGLQNTLTIAFPLLIEVMLMLSFFYTLFAVMGLSLFQNSINRYCFISSDLYPELIRTNQRCGINDKGYTCPNNQICMNAERKDGFNFLNYNDIFHSFLTVFVTSTLEDWTPIMYWTINSEYYISSLFYIVIVIFISLTLLKMFVAVITNTYETVSNTQVSTIKVFVSSKRSHMLAKLYYTNLFHFTMASIIVIEMVSRIALVERNAKILDYRYPLAFELVFCIVYALETILMISCTLFDKILNSPYKVFMIVLCIGNIIAVSTYDYVFNPYLLVFNLLRMPRILSLLPRVERLANAITKSYKELISLFALCVTYIVIGSVILNSIFINFQFDSSSINFIFDFSQFWGSLSGIFQVIIGDGWDNVALNTMYIIENSSNTFNVILFAIFIAIFYVFAHFIIINILVGVILQNFALSEPEKRIRQLKQFLKAFQKRTSMDFDKLTIKSSKMSSLGRNKTINRFIKKKSIIPDANPSKFSFLKSYIPNASGNIQKKIVQKYLKKELEEIEKYENEEILASMSDIDHVQLKTTFIKDIKAKFNDIKLKMVFNRNSDLKLNKFRQFFISITQSRYNILDNVIKMVIFASIIEASMNTPLDRFINYDPDIKWTSHVYFDLAIIIVFSLESFCKIAANGFLLNKNSYLKSIWNRFDFLLLLLQIIGFFSNTDDSTGISRVLRVSKSFRVLRIIHQFKGIRDIFRFFFLAFSKLLDASLLSLIVFVPFALYGNAIYKHLFYSCNDNSILYKYDCINYFTIESQLGIAMLVPRVWQNHYSVWFNFDTFFSSLLTTFTLSTAESWTDIFNLANNSTFLGQQPNKSTTLSLFTIVFFFSFMIIGCLIIVNLFAGIIIQNFLQVSGLAYLTIKQRQFIDITKQIKLSKPTIVPTRPLNSFKASCFDLLKDPNYSKFINGCLFVTVVVNMIQYYGEIRVVQFIRDALLMLCVLVFLIDIIVKFCGYGYLKFRKSKSNILEVFVICGALISLVVEYITQNSEAKKAKRVFILSLGFKLIQHVHILTLLFKIIVSSIAQLKNILGVFIILLLTYALVFIELFGLTRFNFIYNRDANFRDISSAMLLLMRMITGESWHRVMSDCLIDSVYCVENKFYLFSDCGSKAWGLVLFISYYIICAYVLINMFTVVVLENFSYFCNQDVKFSVVSIHDIAEFKSTWATIDKLATGYIQEKDLVVFLKQLKGKLHVSLIPTELRLKQFDLAYFNSCTRETLKAMRIRYNRVYIECMMSATPKGLPFQSILTILTNNVIDGDYLLIDEYLKRKMELEVVNDVMYLEKCTGLLAMLIQRRKYLGHFNKTIPVVRVPDLIIEEEENDFMPKEEERNDQTLNSSILGNILKSRRNSMIQSIELEDDAIVEQDDTIITAVLHFGSRRTSKASKSKVFDSIDETTK